MSPGMAERLNSWHYHHLEFASTTTPQLILQFCSFFFAYCCLASPYLIPSYMVESDLSLNRSFSLLYISLHWNPICIWGRERLTDTPPPPPCWFAACDSYALMNRTLPVAFKTKAFGLKTHQYNFPLKWKKLFDSGYDRCRNDKY